MAYDLTPLIRGCESLKLPLTEAKQEQLIRYYEYMTEKNKVMNLTAITDFQEVLIKHFLDSLSAAAYIDLTGPKRVIDVGTGAGFPGIPLKIMFPDLEILLLDSLNKRVVFLQETIELLKLKKISAVHGRAEEAAMKKEYREQYDYCLSRAVSNLATLAEYCLPFVKKNGLMVSYKSGDVQNEVQNSLKAIGILGGNLEAVEMFRLPESDIERSLIKIRKERNTPMKYPRKAGTPQKEPL